MSLGKLFKSLIGGNTKDQAPETITYKGFTVEAAPIQESGSYRTAGFIIGEHDGEEKRVQFIRADQHNDKQQAVDHAFSKARQIIDEQGSKLLTRSNL
ncbi:MAG: hypothetical protein HKN34_03695 [Gammaproteobacteria bacterium]|nr:hypothetical protein [Gammaproteobacteria bacterium]